MERSWNTSVEISPNCPRCGSSNTKFCYYNNYSLTQPRYFCKACRRYWTKGGSLRNVPVGGGCRKNRRPNKSLRPTDRPPHHVDRSTLLPAGSHIDLALVYANFLNSDNNHIPPETPLTLPLPLPLPSMDQLGSGGRLSFGELVNGYDSLGLPPFPGEEECLWSPSTGDALMKSSSSSSQLLGIEDIDHSQQPNLVSWSSFDLPTFDTFSRP